jgi:hypothetical protein
MGRSSKTRQTGWAGALLLTMQLLTLAVLPLLHVDTPPLMADHVEAPGTHPGGHDGAVCHVCRALDTRFTTTAAAPVAARSATAREVTRWEHGRSAVSAALYLPVAPRGPPLLA